MKNFIQISVCGKKTILARYGRTDLQINQSAVKGEGHSRNGVFFEIANKKITLS